ncbi:sugar ABC transporter ATP-binding protein [Domibacillus enclensis]|uniref:Ribose/galactose/methyl galactoside import ATP-binding protein n=1 Tax=Domibacillus enclensis TaxID=1017273 RepID=A0A1N7ARA4_9BACI|nr:sugar ABC transporter ATP-binding protein [Domibacillus enclensis]OXS75057.1 D-xylose ABC transporter ATP-binding protein [Domibacillus enclensis]SIR41687.1 monosaccharide ABC transporter ATP-binding protein, CUT2 family [Domibacillus enclensis]
MTSPYILQMSDISKSFPGVKALQNVKLDVKKGEVHALMGENGAGKSTLMKILIGIYTADTGSVVFDGEKLSISNVSEALDKGISMIHQELNPVPEMTVAENIFLGREPTYGKTGIVNQKQLIRNTKELFERLNITTINPKAKMIDLTVAKMQLVEIAKAVSFDSKLIIMDEPTSAITDKEVAHLFDIIRSLQKKDVGIIYITHKMEELKQIANTLTVFRDGQYVGTDSIDNMSRERLIEMMVGRELSHAFDKEHAARHEVALEVKNLTKEGKFYDVNFHVRKGEVLGIAGLMGSGRSEILETIFGVMQADAGDIEVNGQKKKMRTPKDAINAGIGLLTEDRKLTGCFLPLSVRDNMIMVNINKYTKNGIINQKRIEDDCEDQKKKMNIKTPNMDQLISNLSGGNQQKVLIGRWLLHNPDILFLDEPTRGIDIGAKSEIYNLIFELAKQGKAIIIVSSEMPEVIGLSDRIVVMSEGYQTGELDRSDATQEAIMELATRGELIKRKTS